MKLISGYELNSDTFLVVFLRGKVQKNAFASRQLICCCDKLIECIFPLRKSGIPVVTSSGNDRASCINLGRTLAKKYSISSSSSVYTNTFVLTIRIGLKIRFPNICVEFKITNSHRRKIYARQKSSRVGYILNYNVE